MKRSCFWLSVLLALSGAAQAEVVPNPGPADVRVKFVDYNDKDVVRVVGHFGFSTHIQFAEGESVTGIAMGDSLAWEVAPQGNHLFVKPREANATTNMSVVTAPNNRVYNFVLTAHQSRNGASPRPNDMFFAVRFRYPEDERKAREAKREAERTASLLDNAPISVRNYNYWACGSSEVTPDEAFDDGRFTFLRFSANRDMPAIFEELTPGREALINTHVDGDWIVIHRVVKRLVLRRGPIVACVENRSFDPRGISTPTGTVSPHVERAPKASKR